MELTIKNLKNVKYSDIAIFDEEKLVDVISKDITCSFAPYTIGGSDGIFDEKEIVNVIFKDKKYFIFDCKTVFNPLKTKEPCLPHPYCGCKERCSYDNILIKDNQQPSL